MIKSINKIFFLLDSSFKKKIILFQLLVLGTSFFEVLGILSIAPLIQVISNVSILIDSTQLVTKIYIYFNMSDHKEFLIVLSIFILIIFLINFLFSVLSTYYLSKFSHDIGNFFKLKLFQSYVLQPWILHSNRDTSLYVNKIINETNRISQNVILPLLNTNSKIIIGLSIVSFIFFYNPKITIICFLTFTFFYLLIYKVIKKKTDKNALEISNSHSVMYKKIFETFGGIKETIMHKKQKKFHDEFKISAENYSRSSIFIQFYQQAPKLLLEFIAFSIIIFSIIYIVSFSEEDLKNTLPVLAIYIFAGYKLLPIFQNIYYGVLSVRANKPAVDSIFSEFSKKENKEFEIETIFKKEYFKFKDKIEINNIYFSYFKGSQDVLKNVNITIQANSFTSIVGRSGSGKSTILDILLGLLIPDKGEILLDGIPLSHSIKNYQNNVSYVGQSIFLNNESIKKNICYGIDDHKIDNQKLLDAIEASSLSELINDLPQGIEAEIGEKGAKLSGGQRQRVAIARALYLDKSIIILDEATSSLDGILEDYILEKLKFFCKNHQKTVVMVTHNINLTIISDAIYLINEGTVIANGKFNDLLENDIFKKLLNERKNEN
jgi:HlyD family secretion protein